MLFGKEAKKKNSGDDIGGSPLVCRQAVLVYLGVEYSETCTIVEMKL